jgi:hypothetical protein
MPLIQPNSEVSGFMNKPIALMENFANDKPAIAVATIGQWARHSAAALGSL